VESEKISSACPTSGTFSVTLVNDPVIGYVCDKRQDCNNNKQNMSVVICAKAVNQVMLATIKLSK
jgi:hypothetical protein